MPPAFGHHEDRTPTHGYAAPRDAAMAAFAKSWRRVVCYQHLHPGSFDVADMHKNIGAAMRQDEAKPAICVEEFDPAHLACPFNPTQRTVSAPTRPRRRATATGRDLSSAVLFGRTQMTEIAVGVPTRRVTAATGRGLRHNALLRGRRNPKSGLPVSRTPGAAQMTKKGRHPQ